MLTVTTQAKKRLKEALREQTANPKVAFRITPFFSEPTKFWLILDNEREDDCVIEKEGDRAILLVNASLAPKLEGMLLDHQGVMH